MTRPTVGGKNRKTQGYSTGYGRRTRRSIRLQFITRPRKLHGGIRCTHRVRVCGRSGNTRLRTLSRSGRSNKNRTWCVFGGFGRICALNCLPSSQWLAPHDVRTGFYRYLKPGQPANDKIHIIGKITAVAPICTRCLHPSPSASHGLTQCVTIAGYRRNFVIIGSATGIYTAQRGGSGKSCSLFRTRKLYNISSAARSHQDTEHHESDVDIHPPRLQQGHHPPQ